jgi:RNA polymerase sigma-70 factor (ECF subfamily)
MGNLLPMLQTHQFDFFTKANQRLPGLRVYKGEDTFVNGRHENGTDDVERLVGASRAGDRSAFDSLVRLYQRRATHLAIRLLGNADDATEVVQQAFVTAYLKIDKLRDPKRFEPWLLKMVTNLAIDHRHARSARGGLPCTTEAIGCEAKTAVSPVENQIGAELAEAIQRAMSKLSGKEAQAISLFGLENLSGREVAEIMGCSVGTARWHVFRARKKLSVLLKDYL